MTHAMLIRFLKECYPKYAGRLYFNLVDLARIYANGNQNIMREFLVTNAVPHCRIGKTNAYCILEVQEIVETTRWRKV